MAAGPPSASLEVVITIFFFFFTKNYDKRHTFNAKDKRVMQARTEKSQQRMRNKKDARAYDDDGNQLYDPTLRFRTDVWDDVASVSSGDKAQADRETSWKPARLFEIMLATSANKGDTFLDLYCGSGPTSLDVAKKLGLNWIGIDPERRVHGLSLGKVTKIPRTSSRRSRVSAALRRSVPTNPHVFESWAREMLGASRPSIDGGIDGFAASEDLFLQAKNTSVTCGHIRDFAQAIKNFYFRTLPRKEAMKRVNSTKPMRGYIVGKRKEPGVEREIELARNSNVEIEFFTPKQLKALVRVKLKRSAA